MNKGLFYHLIATIVFILMVLYITGEETIEIEGRAAVCMIFALIHWIVWITCDDKNYYNEKK
jgi:uncharacterized membrane protein YhaH (DUF805 family)